jgi:hypothetical protein
MHATGPASDDEWTIHALNIHGVFFERWCEKTVADTPGWRVRSTNYPGEFPPPNGPLRGKESTLDIRAERMASGQLLTLTVECKKNNPEFVDWVFFRKQPRQGGMGGFAVFRVENIARQQAEGEGWEPNTSIRMLETSVPLCDEARDKRELRGVQEAARQD